MHHISWLLSMLLVQWFLLFACPLYELLMLSLRVPTDTLRFFKLVSSIFQSDLKVITDFFTWRFLLQPDTKSEEPWTLQQSPSKYFVSILPLFMIKTPRLGISPEGATHFQPSGGDSPVYTVPWLWTWRC